MVNEYATYLLVGISFVGLAYAQKEKAHIRSSLMLGYLPENARRILDIVGHWIGLLFVCFTAWQMISFNYQEYINDTRNWGLLATPQWVPELLVSFGLVFFALAMLADLHRLVQPAKGICHSVGAGSYGNSCSVSCLTRPLSGPPSNPLLRIGVAQPFPGFLVSVWLWSGLRAVVLFGMIVAATALLFFAVQGGALPLISMCPCWGNAFLSLDRRENIVGAWYRRYAGVDVPAATTTTVAVG